MAQIIAKNSQSPSECAKQADRLREEAQALRSAAGPDMSERRPRARRMLEEAIATASEAGDPGRQADCHYELAIWLDEEVDYEGALEHAHQALDLSLAREDRASRVRAANASGLIATVHYAIDDHGNALNYYLQAYRVWEELESRSGVCSTLANMGNLYRDLGRFHDAADACRQAMELSVELGDTRGIALNLGNLAQALSQLGRHDEARQAARRALAVAEPLGDRHALYSALICVGRAEHDSGRPAEAIPVYERGLPLAAGYNSYDECSLHALLGQACLSAGEYGRADACFAEALRLAEPMSIKKYAAMAHRGLARLQEMRGDFAGALAHFERFHAVDKEIFNEQADRAVKALIMVREVEKANQQAEIHRLKTVELAEANIALESAIRQLRQQAELLQSQAEELEAQAEELEEQARVDSLTGLSNRRYLEEWLFRQFAQAQRYGAKLTVALGDIDRFKRINDRFGHRVGDDVLRMVARIFRSECRAGDLAARYGGEEFVLVLAGTDAARAARVCERLRRRVEGYDWRSLHPDLGVTISLGVADDISVASHECLLTLADSQMYRAKRGGRDRVCVNA